MYLDLDTQRSSYTALTAYLHGRATVLELMALVEFSTKPMLLVLADSREFQVYFNRQNSFSVSSFPIIPESNPDQSSVYAVTIRLLSMSL